MSVCGAAVIGCGGRGMYGVASVAATSKQCTPDTVHTPDSSEQVPKVRHKA